MAVREVNRAVQTLLNDTEQTVTNSTSNQGNTMKFIHAGIYKSSTGFVNMNTELYAWAKVFPN